MNQQSFRQALITILSLNSIGILIKVVIDDFFKNFWLKFILTIDSFLRVIVYLYVIYVFDLVVTKFIQRLHSKNLPMLKAFKRAFILLFVCCIVYQNMILAGTLFYESF